MMLAKDIGKIVNWPNTPIEIRSRRVFGRFQIKIGYTRQLWNKK